MVRAPAKKAQERQRAHPAQGPTVHRREGGRAARQEPRSHGEVVVGAVRQGRLRRLRTSLQCLQGKREGGHAIARARRNLRKIRDFRHFLILGLDCRDSALRRPLDRYSWGVLRVVEQERGGMAKLSKSTWGEEGESGVISTSTGSALLLGALPPRYREGGCGRGRGRAGRAAHSQGDVACTIGAGPREGGWRTTTRRMRSGERGRGGDDPMTREGYVSLLLAVVSDPTQEPLGNGRVDQILARTRAETRNPVQIVLEQRNRHKMRKE
ncbi:hypothetical protein FB451DRAFT_1369302 [Mycena latifolia]|nr:hypothetical protein FB451DRAFT_1369302 [Mycena latifolia]